MFARAGVFAQSAVLALVGGGAGGIVAAGVFAFLVIIGVFPRLIGKTRTRARIRLYETLIILGGVWGNVSDIYEFPLLWGGNVLLGIFGLAVGIFVGCLVMSLAETVKTLPVISHSIHLAVGLQYLILAIAAGKLTGRCCILRGIWAHEKRKGMRAMELNKDAYNQYVKGVTPQRSLWAAMGKAFVTGGCICTLGQLSVMGMTTLWGMEKETAMTWAQLELILLSVLFTGWNLYPKLVKWGGAGALVPITGFANSVVAPAVEYKAEGQVFGIGCKIFTIAGPVILYGIFTSWVLGILYWIGQMLGWLPV